MNKFINKVIQGDCLDVLKTLPGNSVDSICCDPPYELGFMGKSWDNTGIANNKEMWAECLRVLKPGGHLLSFSGTRTYHRMASAIEDAGFEVRDMIEWVYGSGFPKSHNIGKNIEKIKVGGIKNLKQIGTKKGIKVETGTQGFSYSKEYVAGKSMGGKQISGDIPVYEINNEYEGWGTALKPAHEPICMARKPLAEKTVAENCLKYGTGGINIDESRVEAIDQKELEKNWTNRKADAGFNGDKTGIYGSGKCKGENIKDYTPLGRFPANLITDGSEEVRECFPESGGGKAKHNSEITRKGIAQDGSSFNAETCGFDVNKCQGMANFGDSGNASRFFKSIIYQAKASKSERNKGMDDIEAKEWKQENSPNPNREERPFLPVKNNHPTVKPIALMEYLIKMVTPKGGIVLDPFAGSGSTLVAAKQNGYKYIGIEMTEEYIPIIEARLFGVENDINLSIKENK